MENVLSARTESDLERNAYVRVLENRYVVHTLCPSLTPRDAIAQALCIVFETPKLRYAAIKVNARTVDTSGESKTERQDKAALDR
jgi:hypothetical protein